MAAYGEVDRQKVGASALFSGVFELGNQFFSGAFQSNVGNSVSTTGYSGSVSAFDDAAVNVNAVEGTSKPIIYGPMNKGPLPDEIANTFRSSTYTKYITPEDLILYRVYGGEAGELGSFWTRSKPRGPLHSIIDSALDQNWGNSATSVSIIKVPAGTTIFEGFAAEQGCFAGGGNQIYIEKEDMLWLIK